MIKIFMLTVLCLITLSVHSQNINCNEICVVNISLDSVTGEMLVTVFNGDSVHINYPTVQVIDINGDTVGNPDGIFNLFAHPAGDTIVHSIPTSLASLPLPFAATVLFTDQIWDITCTFSYPMNCFLNQPPPDCNDLTVENIQLDTIAGLMDVTLFNSCSNCASGINGPVYCEMKIISTVAPYDTLAESDCHCFLTPDNQSFNTYTITSYVNSLPSINDIKVIFFCGTGLCDTLQINPALSITEEFTNPDFSLFPNPTNGELSIKFNNHSLINNLRKIEIIELNGRTVYEQLWIKSFGNNMKLPEALRAGIYNFRMITDDFIIVKKFVLIK